MKSPANRLGPIRVVARGLGWEPSYLPFSLT